MTDIVYPLKSNTPHNCKELLFSLRSVEKHLTGVRDVIIISDELPDWMQGAVLLQGKDYPGNQYKEHNIATKICTACQNSLITDDFLFMNDDHLLNSDYNVAEFPYYYCGNIIDKINARKFNDAYKKSLSNTLAYLNTQQKPSEYYDVHAPILYNKAAFHRIARNTTWKPYGFVIKSLYANIVGVQGEAMEDLKMNYMTDLELINNRQWFSTSNRVCTPELWEKLEALYPDKSRWEK